MEMQTQPATVTFDSAAFARSLRAYREGVAKGDPESTLSLDTSFEISVGRVIHDGFFHMVVCDHRGEPRSVLVDVFPRGSTPPRQELFAVITRHGDDWEAKPKLYYGEMGKMTSVVWVKED